MREWTETTTRAVLPPADFETLPRCEFCEENRWSGATSYMISEFFSDHKTKRGDSSIGHVYRGNREGN